MNIIGQIVEIPAESPIYTMQNKSFASKWEELHLKSQEKQYSLFDGFLVGDHPGVSHFILGQRKGINVGGKKTPLYVIAIDKAENRLFVGAGENHPGLLTTVITINGFSTISENSINPNILFTEKATDVQISEKDLNTAINAKIYRFDTSYYVEFDTPISILKTNKLTAVYYKNTTLTIIR